MATSLPAAPASLQVGIRAENNPTTLQADARVQLKFGAEQFVLAGGLQPSMLYTREGALVVQAQLPEKPFPSQRLTYHSAMGTVISRDEGKTWNRVPLKPGENGVNLEGGGIQLRDGSLLALDSYVVPGAEPGQGVGQLYFSRGDWLKLEGPIDITFNLPGVNFHGCE